jgi:signal transduction histidine kinase
MTAPMTTTGDSGVLPPPVNVLLVDDTPGNLVALSSVLEELGQNLVEARSGEEALRRLLEQDFAVILLDVQMHTLDGFETAKLIRGRRQSQHTPIIFLTAFDDNRLTVEEAYSLGAVDYLVRPVPPAILRAKVQGFVELYQKTEQIRRQADRLRRMERAEYERRLAEERLRRSEARNEELVRAARQKDEFLAMLAHELRNPLAPLGNALFLFRRPDLDPGTHGQLLDMMDRQYRHLKRMVDDLLDVARSTQGKLQLRPERTELTVLAQRAAEGLRHLAETKNQEMTLALPADPVPVEADPTRLQQVLSNLLHNAVKYTAPGGRISLTVERDGSEAVVRVRDTGVGISPEVLPQVFDLFVQADRGLDRSEGGLGIGLTLVRSLVRLHGGRVEAHSAGLGQGSEFVVRLPTLSD